MTKPIWKLQDHPKDIPQHGADDTGSYADVRNIRGCLKANPMYGAQNKGLYMCPDTPNTPEGTPNTPEGTDGRGNVDAETPRVSYREVTERDANQPAVMLGSGLTRPAPPLPPPGNLASEEQVTVSGPEQNEELYMCPDTLNTPEGAETPRVSYREVTECDANQPAVMLGSGLTRPAPPLPPPGNIASGEQVTVSGPEQNEELYMCPDTPNTPEGTDGRGDAGAEIPRVSYRDIFTKEKGRFFGDWSHYIENYNSIDADECARRCLQGYGSYDGVNPPCLSFNHRPAGSPEGGSARCWLRSSGKDTAASLGSEWDKWPHRNYYQKKDINECAMPRKPCQHGACENKDGGYNCTSQHGWTGQKCQRTPTYYNPLDHESTFFTPNGHTMDEGVSGSALKLDSRRSQYANLGNFAGTCFGSTLNCGRGFSLAFWFKRPAGDVRAQYYINSGGHDFTRTRGFTLTKNVADLDNCLYNVAVNGRLFRHEAKVYLPPDLWTHVAVTWLEELGPEIFVNGSAQQVTVLETEIPPLDNDPYTDVFLGSDNTQPGMYTYTAGKPCSTS
uniref:EGF-like domain-containing protein n=1 Tax=Branchiostoma floridae TaxID=7739 RepID=C3Z812_BRAFL|eukprot:XP_002595314.1 hypothetical protein BRAFLDRAFT_87550 [Branchiostoma floridae]